MSQKEPAGAKVQLDNGIYNLCAQDAGELCVDLQHDAQFTH
jgi:hypothetical protein